MRNQAMYNVSSVCDEVVTLHVTSSASSASAPPNASITSTDGLFLPAKGQTVEAANHSLARVTHGRPQKQWKNIIIVVLGLACTGLLLLLGLLLQQQQQHSSSAVRPAAEKSIPDYHARGRFELRSRRALQELPGQAISSAVLKDNCTLTMSDDGTLPDFFLHVQAQCTRNITSNETYHATTLWRMKAKGHARAPFQLFRRYDDSSSLDEGCLTTASDLLHLLTVDACSSPARPDQLFTLAVESLSLEQSRVYFAIRSEERKDECVGLHEDSKLGNIFALEPCSAFERQASQLFYLANVDYSEEFSEYKRGGKQYSSESQ